MDDHTKLFDVLVIEQNENIINLFKVITKKFDLTIKYVRSMVEFFEIIKENNFRFILCDLYSKRIKDAIIIAEVFTRIRLTRDIKGKIFLFSDHELSNVDKSFSAFDDKLDIDFSSIYSFLVDHFDFRTIASIPKEEFNLSQLVKA